MRDRPSGELQVVDCLPCRPTAEIRALVRERRTRELTPGERAAFAGLGD